jgi:hypothetical protein
MMLRTDVNLVCSEGMEESVDSGRGGARDGAYRSAVRREDEMSGTNTGHADRGTCERARG